MTQEIHRHQSLLIAWKNGDEQKKALLAEVLLYDTVLPHAGRILRESGLVLDEKIIVEDFHQFFDRKQAEEFTDVEHAEALAVKYVGEGLLPQRLYPICFRAWQKKDDETFRKYWGLAYHGVFVARAERIRKTHESWLDLEPRDLAVAAYEEMLKVKEREKIKDYGLAPEGK